MDFKLSQAGGYELRPKMAEIEGFAESGPSIRIGLAVVRRTAESEAPLKRRSNRPNVIAILMRDFVHVIENGQAARLLA
jgi:hypothetical protein